jgi:hypothetical protein
MKQKNTIIIIIIGILLITGFLYFLNWRKTKINPTGSTPVISSDLKSIFLSPELDSETLGCLDKVSVDGDPKIGMIKLEKRDQYSDYTYRATLDSAETVESKGCTFTKLNLTYEPEGLKAKFSIYLPKSMSSIGTGKFTRPDDLAAFAGKKIEFKVRYGTDSKSQQTDYINRILGWELEVVYDTKN